MSLDWFGFVWSCNNFVRASRGAWKWRHKNGHLEEGLSYLILQDVIVKGKEEVCFSFHICHSAAFCCPVLYLSGSSCEGRMATESDVQDLWNSDQGSPMVTQDEHPALCVPFYFVHPCETANMMKQLNVEDWNYVSSWWSWISPRKPSFPSVDHSLDVVPVSLIVPCFNCVKFIEDTIVSISKETFEGLIEIVFCDDGSVDGSFFEIQRLCSVHLSDRRRFLVTLLKNDVNRGAGFTRNRCIDSSLGKMLCFVDCDDIMDEKRIEMQMNDHVDDVEIVGCKMRCFPSDSPFYDFVNQLVDSNQLIDFRFREVTVPLPTWFCHRKVFSGKRFLEIRDHPEDLDFFLSHIERGGKIKKIDGFLTHYRIHANQLSRRIHRNVLMQYKAQYFSRFVVTQKGWASFQIWGCGRDAKQFFKHLSPEAKARVSNFLEIDSNKHGMIYNEIRILPIESVSPPFVCCVTIGKNNGIEDKLKPFVHGVDYLQVT